MRSKGLKFLVRGSLLVAVIGCGISPLRAQSGTTGALAGTISDVDNALLPSATVTLSNDATGQGRVTTTGADGHYGFPTLAPGSYGLKFSAVGFKTAQILSVVVNVSENSVVDVKLEAGDAGQTVSCQCTIAHSASSSTGTLVDSKAITAVPLTTRNFTQVLGNAAGAASDVNNAGLLGSSNLSINVNGNTAGSRFTIDGATGGGPGAIPNPDTITQFRIQTSQYDSGYGAHVPTTNLITKSGANDFHGALWEFLRNDVFNANAFFQNATGQPKPAMKQHQFGGTVGGPIRKDKLFFFGSVQATRQINGLDPTSLSTLILAPLTNDRSAATIGSQFCPGNKPIADQAKYKTFAGGTQVACDGSNINPVALRILQLKLPDGTYLVPTPQTILNTGANAGLGFSSYSLPSWYHETHYLSNIDYVVSKKHTVAGRFFASHLDQVRTLGAPNNPGPPTTPGAPHPFQNTGYIVTGKLTSVLSSNLVNEFRFGHSNTHTWGTGEGVPTATSLGMTPADPLFDQAPETGVQGPLGFFRFFGNYLNDLDNRTQIYQLADNLSWVRGKHAIRTGIFVDRTTERRLDIGSARGKITFQNFTDFLLSMSAAQNGSPGGLSNIDSVTANEGAGPVGEVQSGNRYYSIGVFGQDDIKLTPRLTANLGLRWEYLGPSSDPAGRIGTVWPSLLSLMPIPPVSGTYIGNVVAANYNAATLNPHTGHPFGAVPAGVFTSSSNTLYQNNTPLDTFAPRVGFAWQPGNRQRRLVVRGGYGWFYQNPSSGGNPGNSPAFTAPPFAQGFTNTSASNNLSTLQKPFPTTTLGFQLRTPTSQLSDRIGGPDFMVPLLQQWNVAMQFTLFPTLTLDIGYVGSSGTHLLISQGMNQPLLASPTHPVNCGLPNTAAGLGVNASTFSTLGVNAAGCVTTNTSANAYLRVPVLGETPTALADYAYVGQSRYDGFQTTLRKQVSRGLGFQVSYTYSKSMNDNSRLNDQTNGLASWARATFDRTHRLIFNYSYEIPTLVRGNRVMGTLTKGWSFSGVTSIQSGTPLTLTDRRGGSVYGRAGNATITLCPGATYDNLVTSGPENSRITHWFGTNLSGVICNPPVIGSDGATGYGNSGQGIVNGPGQFDWDISLGKATRVGGIHEDSQLQLRMEFYNAFNHPQFSNPGTVFGTASFGAITQTSVAPRLIQFGIKYLF